ncbi:MAG: hypothetical protein MUC42_09830 [Bryobacter sp.]|jgi:hypothetical protein|nr:hypothetical protein [Bryobacter sp.]
MRTESWLSLFFILALPATAQTQNQLQLVLDRLQRLEEQNRELMTEVRALRQELHASRGQPSPPVAAPLPVEAAASATLAERVEVQESRTEELDQAKVSSDHKFPVQLTGTVLFNTYWTGRYGTGQMNPTTAALEPGLADGGGSFRQSTLGFKFQGPSIFGGGHVNGSLYMDFFAGTGTSLNQLFRVRVATLDLDWKRTTLSFAHDKPLLAPREPSSLAQVGVSPLTAAGNLWFWQPQIRLEHRFYFGDTAGLRAQGGVYQTTESITGVPPEVLPTFRRSRPGLQGRFEFWRDFGNGGRLEVAPGFHLSNSLAAGFSLPSRIYSVDWLLRPLRKIEITGQYFRGENVGTVGGMRPSLTFFPNGVPRTVHAYGGWAQFTYRVNQRAWFNFYGGQQSNRAADLLANSINRNRAYAGNFMYRLGANVVAAFEASQVRTNYIGSGTRLVPHYDLALAYMF